MSDCIFCQIIDGAAPASRVFEDDHLIAFLDIYPARPGHLLVVPKEHQMYVGDLAAGHAETLFGLGVRLAAALRASPLPCDDVHFVLNDGRAANQTVPHVHLHLVPRRRGDLLALATNLLARPVRPLLGPANRATLDAQADAIRAHL